MIPSIVDQLTAATRAPKPDSTSPRRARRENILVLMLGKNVYAADLARHYKKSLTMIQEDLQSIADDGHAVSWVSDDARYRRRLWGLTKHGIQRAKELKEMSE